MLSPLELPTKMALPVERAQVGEWSAGCQVIANPTNFAKLIALAEKHRGLYGNTFTYTLLRQEDV